MSYLENSLNKDENCQKRQACGDLVYMQISRMHQEWSSSVFRPVKPTLVSTHSILLVTETSRFTCPSWLLTLVELSLA